MGVDLVNQWKETIQQAIKIWQGSKEQELSKITGKQCILFFFLLYEAVLARVGLTTEPFSNLSCK